MATWHRRSPRSRPSRQQNPPTPTGMPAGEQDSGSSQVPRETRDLTREAEQALAPGEPDPGQDDAAGRLRADQLVVEAILEEGIGGARQQVLEEELIRYAVPVLQVLLADGRLISKATRLGRPPGSPGAWLDFTEADREEFALDMVADALPVFRRAVFEDRHWSPEYRASLTTYFVNACIRQFARLHARWLKGRQAVKPVGLKFAPDADGPNSPDPANTVVQWDEAGSLLAKMTDAKLLEAVILRAAGYTAADAAREVGLTPKAAERRLARFRESLKDEEAAGPSGNSRPGAAPGRR